MGEREQIINFLLQSCDAKNRQFEQLQQRIAQLSKKLQDNGIAIDDAPATAVPAPVPANPVPAEVPTAAAAA